MCVLLGCAVLLLVTASVAAAEDSDRTRFYLGVRGQDTNPLTGVHDYWGLSLGANLGRHVGVELAAEHFERFVTVGGRTVGEFGILALVPQLRLRYPILDDRLVPYGVVGVGLGLTEFNDRKTAGIGRSIKNEASRVPLGMVGGGVEYFFADNMAIGIEIKYLVASDLALRIDGVKRDQPAGSLLMGLGLRLFVPELRPPSEAGHADTRFYVATRAGTAVSTRNDGFADLRVRPEPPAYFSAGNQFWGAGFGADIGRHWGTELAAEGYEVRIALPGRGSLGEVAVIGLIPQVRWRYPLYGDRLVPYVLGGVGLGYAEFNDRKAPAAKFGIKGNSFGVAAVAGLGLEYLVASNIAVGLEARYLTSRGHTIKVATLRTQDGGFEAVAVALALRAYVFQLGHR